MIKANFHPMNRDHQLNNLHKTAEWDLVVIGGGASGLGTAVDAASRGFKVVLFESMDFAKGTSSRSTKLVHGGVRYLAQGNIKLVSEALKERGLLQKNANHLVKNQKFVIPNYSWWGGYYYTIGLKMYDFLAKKLSFGKSRLLNKKSTLKSIPTLSNDGLRSGVSYQDGQFDDARLAVNLAATAIEQGATVMNYMKVIDLLKDSEGNLTGVKVEDQESKQVHEIKSKVVVNATGVFANKILKIDGRKKKGLKVVPSQGIHLVFDQRFLKSEDAVMIPKTSDGRVLFAIPWHNKVVIGTTDTPMMKPKYDPNPLEEEIDFILETANKYLSTAPKRTDVLSVYAGLRPLVAPEGDKKNTKEISRGHRILVSDSGLISIVGGKWTTYRHMAEEIVDKAIEVHVLPSRPSVTEGLKIHGCLTDSAFLADNYRYYYGSDEEAIAKLEKEYPDLVERIHHAYQFTKAEVIWNVRFEMARTIEDVLARRCRLLFLDAQAAIEAAPIVADLISKELGKDDTWKQNQLNSFIDLANSYLIS